MAEMLGMRVHSTGRACACVLLAITASACANATPARELVLATTTSTAETGLLDSLSVDFERQTGIRLKIISVGSGAALELGRRGEADVLLVHSPDAEEEFMRAGYGVDRRAVMYNDFVIVGPARDPAGIGREQAVVSALHRIVEHGAIWVRRDDGSGTDALDKRLWRLAGQSPEGDGLIRSGQGMGATLRLADERNAYTLSDRGTYLAFRSSLSTTIVHERDTLLINEYHVIRVPPDRFGTGRIRAAEAAAFVAFLTAEETQNRIGRFGTERHGESLFHPGEPRAR